MRLRTSRRTVTVWLHMLQVPIRRPGRTASAQPGSRPADAPARPVVMLEQAA
ncbi:hypothetical protein ABZS66_37790 [Dactylosporangium sp. NPDC005572]|uniref:hypothetical protein n=1 Tax=Dactylosporangium sp. NPDC005572 TaxID=3156889 RepID=UPI0033BD1B37